MDTLKNQGHQSLRVPPVLDLDLKRRCDLVRGDLYDSDDSSSTSTSISTFISSPSPFPPFKFLNASNMEFRSAATFDGKKPNLKPKPRPRKIVKSNAQSTIYSKPPQDGSSRIPSRLSSRWTATSSKVKVNRAVRSSESRHPPSGSGLAPATATATATTARTPLKIKLRIKLPKPVMTRSAASISQAKGSASPIYTASVNLVCAICGKVRNSHTSYRLHKLFHAQLGFGKDDYVHQCPAAPCLRRFRTLDNLELHLVSHSKSRVTPFQCESCKRYWVADWALEFHQTICPAAIRAQQSRDQYSSKDNFVYY